MPENAKPADHPNGHEGASFVPPQFVENALVAERRRLRQRLFAFGLPGLVITGLVIEPMTSGASLITPISGSLLWLMRSVGMLMGVSFAILTRDLSPAPPTRHREGPLGVALVALVFGFMGLASFDAFAWRAARWTAFYGSDQVYSSATYALTTKPDGVLVRKGQVRIDPFDTGRPVAFRLSPEQGNAVNRMSGAICITVKQRRSPSGEIEVLTDGSQPFGTPDEKQIGPCSERRE